MEYVLYVVIAIGLCAAFAVPLALLRVPIVTLQRHGCESRILLDRIEAIFTDELKARGVRRVGGRLEATLVTELLSMLLWKVYSRRVVVEIRGKMVVAFGRPDPIKMHVSKGDVYIGRCELERRLEALADELADGP